jgi:ABC-2 type transport system permease protein
MFRLFQAELKRVWIEFIRYPLDTASTIIITSIFFYGLFLSIRYVAGPNINFGSRLDAIVVGYVLWTLVTFIVQVIAFGLQTEAQTGTIEQLFLSPYGTLKVFIARALANVTTSLVMTVSVLCFTMVLTGRYLYFSPLLIFPLITVLLAAYGLSLMMGALTLLFKRVGQMLGLVQFGMFFLLTIPAESWTGPFQALKIILPMTLGAGILRDLMALNISLDLPLIFLALLNGIGYFVLGSLIFLWAERKAKHQGILNGY